MYCPKCNQQQVSEEMRFCSRCGFPLAGVALLLEHNGMIPKVPREPIQKRPPSRKQIMKESAIFTAFAWAFLILATFIFDYGGAFESGAKIAAALFGLLGLIGLIRFLYGFLIAKDFVFAGDSPSPGEFSNPSGARGEAPNRFALPPQQSLPISDYPRRANTKEMMQPSVTENTTRLLEQEPGDRSD